MNDESLERILSAIPRLTVAVVGDLFLDRYLDIDATLTEPSIETGLDAYQVVQVRAYPGAAGTVINNLVALGVGHIFPISMIGEDGDGSNPVDLGVPPLANEPVEPLSEGLAGAQPVGATARVPPVNAEAINFDVVADKQ